jgi:hypothetical protein
MGRESAVAEREDVKPARTDLIVRHDPPETGAAPDPTGREERAANAFDRYSLALQLIQVFPIISVVAEVFVQNSWLARVFAGVGLFAGTVWVVQMERSGGVRRRRESRPPRSTELVDSGRLSAEVVGEDNEINIFIRLRTTPTVLQAPVERRSAEPPM